MKTLKTIQTLSKIGKIFSNIVCIFCIIGIGGCAVGMLAMGIAQESIKLGGVTLHSILQAEAGVSTGTVWAAMIAGIFLCIGEWVVAHMAHRYFDNELKAGTPFTLEGAKELMHLGISAIWIPLAAAILGQIAQDIIAQFTENVAPVKLDGFDSVAMGVMMIVLSLFCKYGAEVRGESAQTDDCVGQ